MTLHNGKIITYCEPDVRSKSVQMQTFNYGQFRELFAYFLTEFYCTTHSVDMLPKGLSASQVEMIKNLVAYFNVHQKSILTIECLPNRLKKKEDEDTAEPPDADPLHIERPGIDPGGGVDLGDFNPNFKIIPVPIPGIVVPIPGGSGDDKIEVKTEIITKTTDNPIIPDIPDAKVTVKRILI